MCGVEWCDEWWNVVRMCCVMYDLVCCAMCGFIHDFIYDFMCGVMYAVICSVMCCVLWYEV